jgi:uncharacterized protein (TIGR03435 family)
MNIRHIAIPGLMAAIGVFAQVPAPKLEFEVASIKPSAPITDRGVNVGLHLDGSQVSCIYLSLKDYLGMAYKVRIYQISGPDWLASEHFDISAKLPEGSKADQIPEMLQALLAERFGLRLHREQKDLPVYALVTGKNGVKMKESESKDQFEGEGGKVNVSATGNSQGTTINFGQGSYMSLGNNRLEGKKLPMLGLAETLARFVDRPVIDMTGLKANYDFTLEFTPEDFRAMMIRAAIAAGATLPPEALRLLDGSTGDSLLSGLETIGLKLDARKAPIDVLVIDQAEKTPSAN